MAFTLHNCDMPDHTYFMPTLAEAKVAGLLLQGAGLWSVVGEEARNLTITVTPLPVFIDLFMERIADRRTLAPAVDLAVISPWITMMVHGATHYADTWRVGVVGNLVLRPGGTHESELNDGTVFRAGVGQVYGTPETLYAGMAKHSRYAAALFNAGCSALDARGEDYDDGGIREIAGLFGGWYVHKVAMASGRGVLPLHYECQDQLLELAMRYFTDEHGHDRDGPLGSSVRTALDAVVRPRQW